MDVFATLAAVAQKAGAPFLLIGGHAVNAYGYQRNTLDVDILICDIHLDLWKRLLTDLGYRWGHETSAFVQFLEPENSDQFPVDLMVVDAGTFGKLQKGSSRHRLGDTDLPLPRVLDLIALKLHALRSPTRAAKGKDLPDIIGLMKHHGFDLSHPELAAILDRHATQETREEIRHQLARR